MTKRLRLYSCLIAILLLFAIIFQCTSPRFGSLGLYMHYAYWIRIRSSVRSPLATYKSSHFYFYEHQYDYLFVMWRMCQRHGTQCARHKLPTRINVELKKKLHQDEDSPSKELSIFVNINIISMLNAHLRRIRRSFLFVTHSHMHNLFVLTTFLSLSLIKINVYDYLWTAGWQNVKHFCHFWKKKKILKKSLIGTYFDECMPCCYTCNPHVCNL